MPSHQTESDRGSPRTIILGLCAMAKKAKSKPMIAILTRLQRQFNHIRILVFEERDVLEHPVESWPRVDALISFYSHGFPLEKVARYAELRRPFLVNDLLSQKLLMDRQKVYERLQEKDIPVVRYAVCHRPDSAVANQPADHVEDLLVEAEDHIVLNGVTFHKPFVEKPLDADDHNIRIYFPSAAGGGSVRLFRKVGNRSSIYYQQHSRVRRSGSYIYEDFMVTDGTDIKVYAIGGDYAHAEARKSPALDGKVERDPDGKELRYPVILTAREKIIAKKVVEAFSQTVCGFDLLRANGVSYVCDVNGFSFVKSSNKYYDDCAFILATLLTQAIAPSLSLSVSCPRMDQPPLVRTTFGTVMELRCLIAVIRHSDRTPKQKLKTGVFSPEFYRLFNRHRGGVGFRRFEAKLKKPAALQELLNAARSILVMQANDSVGGQCRAAKEDRASMELVRQVLEMHGRFRGINRKAQLKFTPRDGSTPLATAEAEVGADDGQLLLVLKWGGSLTEEGRAQAEKLGRAFRVIYPGGNGYPRGDGLGLLRLHSTYRHDLKIYASDEGRVQTTAAAFAKGFLDLEGPLTPILVQMVKSANTNGLLDSDNDARRYMSAVKSRIQAAMSVDRDFDEADVRRIAPDGAAALIRAMCNIGNPVAACRRMLNGMAALTDRLERMLGQAVSLYHGESVDLALGRWQKLMRDFQRRDGQFHFAKVPDIYDNIKYDLLHNASIFNSCGSVTSQLYFLAKSMAEIVVPSEYGLNKMEKLLIAQQICNPLLKKLLTDMQYTSAIEVEESPAPGTIEANASVAGEDSQVSRGIRSLNATQPQERFVRTRLYFTSESHLHSVINALRYGDLADPISDEQWARAIDYCGAVTELNYLTQIVFMIYEDPQQPADSDNRYHVELHFSPGCVSAAPDAFSDATAPVVGYRPRRHGGSAYWSRMTDASGETSSEQQQVLSQEQQQVQSQEQQQVQSQEQQQVQSQEQQQVQSQEHQQVQSQEQQPVQSQEQQPVQSQEQQQVLSQEQQLVQSQEQQLVQSQEQQEVLSQEQQPVQSQEQQPVLSQEQQLVQSQEQQLVQSQEQQPVQSQEQQQVLSEQAVPQHRSAELSVQRSDTLQQRVGRFELSPASLASTPISNLSSANESSTNDSSNRQRQNSWSHLSIEASNDSIAESQQQQQQRASSQSNDDQSPSSAAVVLSESAVTVSAFHASNDVKRMLRHISSKSLVLPAADPKQNLISTSLIRSSDPEFHSSSTRSAAQFESAPAELVATEAAAAAVTAAAEASKETASRFTSSSATDKHRPLAAAPCVPGIYPLETLHNSLTLRQVELFLHRFTRLPRRPPGAASYLDC